MLFSFIPGWSDLLCCPLCIFLCCCRDGTAATATKADMTYCNNFVSWIMIWLSGYVSKISFFHKWSLILHEIMKLKKKILFLYRKISGQKMCAAILIWGYNSTWKLEIIVYKLPHFANLQVAQRKIFTIASKFINIFLSLSQ